MAVTRGTAITPKMYDTVKKLLKAGLSQSEIKKLVGIAQSSISRINRTEKFEDLAAMIKAEKEKYRKPKKPDVPEKPVEEEKPIEHRIVIQTNQYMIEEMKKANELLNLINNKLGAIIDDLYGVKS